MHGARYEGLQIIQNRHPGQEIWNNDQNLDIYKFAGMTLISSKRMISHWRIRRYKTKTHSLLGEDDNAGDA